MPKKVIGQELTQDDIRWAMEALVRDHNVHDVQVLMHYEANGWIAVSTECWDYNHTPARRHFTHTTYITQRGPHLDTCIARHLMSLWHVVDRVRADLPPLLGY